MNVSLAGGWSQADYNFINDRYKENWGNESWQMVRTADGWKIAGVVWSEALKPVRQSAPAAR